LINYYVELFMLREHFVKLKEFRNYDNAHIIQ